MKFTLQNNWDEYNKDFAKKFTIENEYVVCGFGGGFRVLKQLFPKIKIKYILDGDPDISCNEYENYTYKSVPDDSIEERKFIITPGSEYFSEIRQEIICMGAKPENIASLNELLYFWGKMYLDGKLYSTACNLILLTSCNLKCRGCSQYVPYIKKSRYINIEDVKATIDSYFSVFDFVGNLMPVGGETFLYKELGELLCYISDNYSERYSEIQIFTNGIITPSDKLAEIMSKIKNLRVIISDYSDVINHNHSGIIDMLEKHNISYTLNTGFGQSSEKMWLDLGDPNTFRYEDDFITQERFHKCSLICNNIVNSKLYYCVPACFSEIGSINADKEEYCLDLENIKNMEDSEKYDVIGRFLLGFPPKGYLEHCKYCNGYGKEVNTTYVRAGEQAGNVINKL